MSRFDWAPHFFPFRSCQHGVKKLCVRVVGQSDILSTRNHRRIRRRSDHRGGISSSLSLSRSMVESTSLTLSIPAWLPAAGCRPDCRRGLTARRSLCLLNHLCVCERGHPKPLRQETFTALLLLIFLKKVTALSHQSWRSRWKSTFCLGEAVLCACVCMLIASSCLCCRCDYVLYNVHNIVNPFSRSCLCKKVCVKSQ